MKLFLAVCLALLGIGLAVDAYSQGHVGAALIFGAATCLAVLACAALYPEDRG